MPTGDTATTDSVDPDSDAGVAAPGSVAPDGPARGRLGVLGSLCGLVFLVNFARVVFAPLLEVFRAEFLLSGGEAGLIATLAWVGSAVPRLPVGYLLTRVPRRHVVLGTGAVLTGAAAFTSTAGDPAALYAGALLMGLSTGGYFLSANPLLSELFPERVGWAMGTHGVASQLAAVGAPLAVGAVLAVANWRAVFGSVALAGAVATLGTYLAARRAELPGAGAEDRDLLAAVRAQWRLVAVGVLVVGVVGFLWNGLFNFYVTYLIEVKGLAPGRARTVLTLVFAAGVPAFFLTGRAADRLPYVPLLLGVVAAFVAGVLALTAVSGLLAVVAVSLVLGYVIHSLFPVVDTYLLDSLPDRHRASAYATYSAGMMLVQSTGSVVLGSLRDAGVAYDTSLRALSLAVVGVLVLLGGLHYLGRVPTGPTRPDPAAGDRETTPDRI